MLRQPTAPAPRNLHVDPLRSQMLGTPGSTQTEARPGRVRSSASSAPHWPRPLHPHHAPGTPSTPRAPPQPRPSRPGLLPPWAPPILDRASPRTRPGRMAQRTKHPCASTGLTEVAAKEGCQCFGSSCQRANKEQLSLPDNYFRLAE